MSKKAIFKKSLEVTRYAAPISANSILNIIATFIAMIFVARLGTIELAAAALAGSTFVTFLTLGSACIYAVGILISQHYGQNNIKAIAHIVNNAVWVFLGLAFIVSFIIWHGPFILTLFHQNPAIIKLTVGYFHGAALFITPVFLSYILTQFYIGTGKPNIPMLLTLIRLPIVIALSYGLVLGKFGLPQLGLAGVSYSLFIVVFSFLIIHLVVLKLSPYGRKYQLFEDIFNIDFPLCKKILLLGIPIGVQFSAEIMAMTIATYFLGEFGVDALAASQIVGQYAVIIIMIILGFSQALALLISRDFHNNNVSHVKHYFWAAILPLGLCLVVIGYFFIGHPILLMRLFVTTNLANHVEIYYLGTAFFAIAFAFLTIDSLRNLLSGALRGMHDSKTPMRIGVLCLWFISLPFCYVVGFWLHGGPIGLRLSFILGFALACFWLWVRLQKRITESSLNPIFNL